MLPPFACRARAGFILLRFLLQTLLFTLGLMSAACSSRPMALHEESPAEVLQWPPAPETARIEWVKTIEGYQDIGISDSLWRKLTIFFTGENQENFVRPHGLLYDTEERLFVADPGAGVVHVFDIKNNRYHVIGREEKEGPVLLTPIGITEDDQQNLYITDSTAGMIYRYDLQKRRLQPFLAVPLQRPTGIVWNRSNRLLYIVDTLGAVVVAVDVDGWEKLRIGGQPEEAKGFNHPTDIWAGADGRLYVTDPLNYRISMFTSTGESGPQIGEAGDTFGSLNKPKGVATDSQGHIYVCDALHDAVKIFNDSGQLLLAFGSVGTDKGEFWMPSGIFIDHRDYIFVSDTYNRRVQVFRYLPAETDGTENKLSKPGKH